MQSLNVIVVHCSDGVGRSGTYVLIDMVLNRLSKGCREIWNLCNVISVSLTCFYLTNFLFDSCALQRRLSPPRLRKIARRSRAQTDTMGTKVLLFLCNALIWLQHCTAWKGPEVNKMKTVCASMPLSFSREIELSQFGYGCIENFLILRLNSPML